MALELRLVSKSARELILRLCVLETILKPACLQVTQGLNLDLPPSMGIGVLGVSGWIMQERQFAPKLAHEHTQPLCVVEMILNLTCLPPKHGQNPGQTWLGIGVLGVRGWMALELQLVLKLAHEPTQRLCVPEIILRLVCLQLNPGQNPVQL